MRQPTSLLQSTLCAPLFPCPPPAHARAALTNAAATNVAATLHDGAAVALPAALILNYQ